MDIPASDVSHIVSALVAKGASSKVIQVFLEGMAKSAMTSKSSTGQHYRRDLSGPCAVYCLVHPKTHKPFYIGISKHPNWRFYEHSHEHWSAAYPTLTELLTQGYHQSQILKIYKVCSSRRSAHNLEYNLIAATPGLTNRGPT